VAATNDGFVWFDNARVVGSPLSLEVEVDGHRIPLPVIILHPDCTFRGVGDTGRLGVPLTWARERGLCSSGPTASDG
jgi:hypothetical protein